MYAIHQAHVPSANDATQLGPHAVTQNAALRSWRSARGGPGPWSHAGSAVAAIPGGRAGAPAGEFLELTPERGALGVACTDRRLDCDGPLLLLQPDRMQPGCCGRRRPGSGSRPGSRSHAAVDVALLLGGDGALEPG